MPSQIDRRTGEARFFKIMGAEDGLSNSADVVKIVSKFLVTANSKTKL